MSKYVWARRKNGTWYCCKSLVQTCGGSTFVYVNVDDPSFDQRTKDATDAINKILTELKKYGPDDGRSLSILSVPDPNDTSDDPDFVSMLMWTWGDIFTSETDIPTIREIPYS